MSAFLTRTQIIDHRRCDIVLPSLRLEESNVTLGPPSPFAHYSHQTEMVQRLSEAFQYVDDASSLDQIITFRQIVQDWMDELPKVYSTHHPDMQWDCSYWYVVWQRRNLHVLGYLTMFLPLRACLVKNVETLPHVKKELIAMAVECSYLLLSSLERLLESIFPDATKHHFAIFCCFESVFSLCSAIQNDDEVSIPRWDLLIKVIKPSLEILERLQRVNKIWIAPRTVLANLRDKLTLTPGERTQQSGRNLDSQPKQQKKQITPPGNLSNRILKPTSPKSQICATPVFDVFLGHFVDSFGPRNAGTSSTLHWIHTGRPYQMLRAGIVATASSPLLRDAYQAISTVFYGLSVRDERLVHAGAKIYPRILRSLQAAIYHPEQRKSDAVLMTVILCITYEVGASTRE